MNAASLKVNMAYVREQGIIIVNSEGFDERSLKLAGYGKKSHSGWQP